MIADDYFRFYSGSSRTRQSVKTKIANTKAELVKKFGNNKDLKVEESPQSTFSSFMTTNFDLDADAWDFLQPFLVQQGDQYLFVHLKKQWKEIKVGIKKNTMRFILTKLPVDSDEYHGSAIEGKQIIAFQVSAPVSFKVEAFFEDEIWKGASLKLKNIVSEEKEDDDFDMQ